MWVFGVRQGGLRAGVMGGGGYMGKSRNRDCQWVSRNVFEDFTEDFGSLFRTGTALMLKAHW